LNVDTKPSYTVRRNRAIHDAENEACRKRFEQPIKAHVEAHQIALDWLSAEHQRLADERDFNLVGDTRAAATWQLSGRCIGLARLILDTLTLGYAAEVLHLARALHEADRLLEAVYDPAEDGILRRWLADKENVKPADARQAQQRANERLAAPSIERSATLTKSLYNQFSAATHHRRQYVQDAVSPALRTMTIGANAPWIRQAITTAVMVSVVEEAVMAIGGCN